MNDLEKTQKLPKIRLHQEPTPKVMNGRFEDGTLFSINYDNSKNMTLTFEHDGPAIVIGSLTRNDLRWLENILAVVGKELDFAEQKQLSLPK